MLPHKSCTVAFRRISGTFSGFDNKDVLVDNSQTVEYLESLKILQIDFPDALYTLHNLIDNTLNKSTRLRIVRLHAIEMLLERLTFAHKYSLNKNTAQCVSHEMKQATKILPLRKPHNEPTLLTPLRASSRIVNSGLRPLRAAADDDDEDPKQRHRLHAKPSLPSHTSTRDAS